MMDLGSRESFNCTAASTMLAERAVRSTGTLNDIIESHTNSMVLWLHGFCDNLPFAEAQDIIQTSLISLWLWCEKKGHIDFSESEYIRLWKTFSKNNLLHWLRKDRQICPMDVADLSSLTDDEDNKRQAMREELNMYFEILSDKERALMNMLLDGFSAEDICQTLGYKDTSVLKNVKCRALRKMKSAAAQKRCSYTA